jgi:hypothetical protein
MRETRLSGSEGGATLIWSSLPLSITGSLRDKDLPTPVHEIDSTPALEDEDDDEYEDEKRPPTAQRLPRSLRPARSHRRYLFGCSSGDPHSK